MGPQLPPPDPHEWFAGGPAGGMQLAGPAAIFMAGPPSPAADRLSDAILAYRPGALFIVLG
jgi:hypothetical protein